VEEPISPDVEGDLVERPALVSSLFPHMSPTLYFSTANERGWHTQKALTLKGQFTQKLKLAHDLLTLKSS